MPRLVVPLCLTLLFLLGALPVLAHGHDPDESEHGAGMDMGHSMTMAGVEAEPSMPSYFLHSQHAGLMFAHIAIMVLSWAVVLPLAVMLSIGRSRLAHPWQMAFLAINTVGILVGCIYNHTTPDLYENNAHHKLGWVVTCAAVAWTVLAFVSRFTTAPSSATTRPSIHPVSQEAMAEFQKFQSSDRFRWSQDSGHGTDRNTASLASSSRSNSWNPSDNVLPMAQQADLMNDEQDEKDEEKRGFLDNDKLRRFADRHHAIFGNHIVTKVSSFVHVFLERSMLVLAFFAIITGMVTYSGIGRGHHVFNVLAHLIKGGIFFWYGLLTFGRWMGCFADFGWAWNVKPGAELVGTARARIPSAEFTESFVIFFYGASNVFLEHLGGWGKAWTPMDFEHVSITIMFFGGGLLGMLIESRRVRDLLSYTLGGMEAPSPHAPPEWQTPSSYIHSLNPVPALVILLLGIMMSSHTQHSVIAGQIHRQWGLLFAGFALSRTLTYISLWLKPPTSYFPARPPTELLASFCLVSGGAIFMASNSDTIGALDYYDLDSMFVFTVMMGVTSLIMAWALAVLAVKGWATRKANKAVGRGKLANASA